MKKLFYLSMAAFVLIVACNKEKVIPPTGISLDYKKALIALDQTFTLTATLAPAVPVTASCEKIINLHL